MRQFVRVSVIALPHNIKNCPSIMTMDSVGYVCCSYHLLRRAFTHTGSSFMTGLFTAITPDRLCGT